MTTERLWYFHGESDGQGWASFRVTYENAKRVWYMDDLDEPPREKSIARSLLVDGAGWSRSSSVELHSDERHARILAIQARRGR